MTPILRSDRYLLLTAITRKRYARLAWKSLQVLFCSVKAPLFSMRKSEFIQYWCAP
jgi:hypothetical protein